MTESIAPRSYQAPEIRYQPSLLSVPSAAHTVAPEETPIRAHRQPAPTSWRKLWFFTALSALLGTAAAGSLHSSRVSSHVHSASPTLKLSQTGRELMWQKRDITVHLDGSLQKLGPQANDAVMQAFGQWVGSDPKLPEVRFDTGQTSSLPQRDGKNTVSYAAITTPGHERDVAITVTYANDKTGEIIEADVVLNALYPMGVLTPKPKDAGATHDASSRDDEAMDCQNRYDAQNVATHEAGHFFGLGEDTTEQNATMFLSIDECETHKRVLSSTDVSAVTTLYAASREPEQEQASAASCRFGGVPATGGSALVSALIFGLGLARRRRAR